MYVFKESGKHKEERSKIIRRQRLSVDTGQLCMQRVGVVPVLCRGCVKRKGLLCRCCVSSKGLLCRLQSLINPKSITMSSTAVGQFGCDGDTAGRRCCVSRKGNIVSVGRGILCRLQSLINPKLITIRM